MIPLHFTIFPVISLLLPLAAYSMVVHNSSLNSRASSPSLSLHLNETVHLLKRGNKEIIEGYVFVGYHGSCSHYKASLEERIKVGNREKVSWQQLGKQRFYTTDSVWSANYWGERACRSPKFEETESIVCPVFIKENTLRKLPKIYIPRSVLDPHGKPFRLWGEYDNMDEIEMLAGLQNPQPVRLAAVVVYDPYRKKETYSGMQVAWPAHAVKHMKVTECVDWQLKNDEKVKVNYTKMLEDSKSGVENNMKVWGRPIFGADLFQFSTKTDGITDDENIYTELLRRKPAKS